MVDSLSICMYYNGILDTVRTRLDTGDSFAVGAKHLRQMRKEVRTK